MSILKKAEEIMKACNEFALIKNAIWRSDLPDKNFILSFCFCHNLHLDDVEVGCFLYLRQAELSLIPREKDVRIFFHRRIFYGDKESLLENSLDTIVATLKLAERSHVV